MKRSGPPAHRDDATVKALPQHSKEAKRDLRWEQQDPGIPRRPSSGSGHAALQPSLSILYFQSHELGSKGRQSLHAQLHLGQSTCHPIYYDPSYQDF